MDGRSALDAASDSGSDDRPPVRVMALHALAYCERLFYLEEVEEIRVADHAVFAGRELHTVLEGEDPSGTEVRGFDLSSQRLGLMGRVDAFRRREGFWVPYEHKRGRSARGHGGTAAAWPADQLQVGAYALLLEEHLGEAVPEGRVRYHETGVTVRVAVDAVLRQRVADAVRRVGDLRASVRRPPVTDNPRLCLRCSLAPVCLPEEARLAEDRDWKPVRLFPPERDGTVLHVTSGGSAVGRAGDRLTVRDLEGSISHVPIEEVDAVIVHGTAQVTTQAIHLCAAHGIAVHWLTGSGQYVGGISAGAYEVQRRLRQYEALSDERFCLTLARRLAEARVSSQLRFLLRATRGSPVDRTPVSASIEEMRAQLRQLPTAASIEETRGREGAAARAYFEAIPNLVKADVDSRLRPSGRSRRPPRDRFNAALSFLYGLLFKEVAQAIRSVGLDPALGFFHTPRTASPPLVLDLMELFRVPLCDLPLIASLNRRQWDPEDSFAISGERVWLSDQGRRLVIDLFEKRLHETWQHPVIGYSLGYARTIELEVRLLEKEWMGEGGLFARSRLR